MAREYIIDIPMEEGEPLGAVPNDKLVIVKVQPGTLADGKLKVGDQILKLNGSIINDSTHFFHLLRSAPPCATLLIARDEARVAELKAQVHIPPERAKYITRRDGYTYILVKITWKPGGPKLGLGIKHYQNRVLVSRCDPKSIAAKYLEVGDHLIDIDGKPVTDKDVCRQMLVKGLQKKHVVTTVVERPDSAEARRWVQAALRTSTSQLPSVAMNSDVREIAARQRARLRTLGAPKKSCLRTVSSVAKKVNFDDSSAVEYVIASDTEGKSLRHVKKS